MIKISLYLVQSLIFLFLLIIYSSTPDILCRSTVFSIYLLKKSLLSCVFYFTGVYYYNSVFLV